MDYWQFKVLHSALICFTNPASPNFFTGRAGFVLRTHTAHLPKSALGLLTFTRFSISLQIFILKIFHSINLVHMGSYVPAQNPQKKGSFFQTSRISPFLRIFTSVLDIHTNLVCLKSANYYVNIRYLVLP